MNALVQAFGAVGAPTANNLAKHGIVIAAVSKAWGSLVSTGPESLHMEPLFKTWKEEGHETFRRYEGNPPPGSQWMDRSAVFAVPAENFVPAARTDVIVTAEEIADGFPEAFEVERLEEVTGVRVVLEGTNHPLTEAAEWLLERRKACIIPDSLVNCGGLIGCWPDWGKREPLLTGTVRRCKISARSRCLDIYLGNNPGDYRFSAPVDQIRTECSRGKKTLSREEATGTHHDVSPCGRHVPRSRRICGNPRHVLVEKSLVSHFKQVLSLLRQRASCQRGSNGKKEQ